MNLPMWLVGGITQPRCPSNYFCRILMNSAESRDSCNFYGIDDLSTREVRLTLTGAAISLLGPLATCIHLVVVCREIRAVLLNIAVTWNRRNIQHGCNNRGYKVFLKQIFSLS